jgi:hypothetical protein
MALAPVHGELLPVIVCSGGLDDAGACFGSRRCTLAAR